MDLWLGGNQARERLVVAAVDLFTERGYDATTHCSPALPAA
jgi:hypothetical protein